MQMYWAIGVQSVLATVFAVSVFSKVRSGSRFIDFVKWISGLTDLSGIAAHWAALCFLVLEAIALLALVLPGATPMGLSLSLVILVAFALGIEWAVRRGRLAPCRCFGVSTVPLNRSHILRNLILAGLALSALAIGWDGTPDLAGAILALACGGISGLLFIRFDEVVELFSSKPTQAIHAKAIQSRRRD
jgi:Methylamine utilisation protein MauE